MHAAFYSENLTGKEHLGGAGVDDRMLKES
jgi:hypothetical protein